MRSNSSASISKKLTPVFGRVIANVFTSPGFAHARMTCARPYMSRRMR